MPVAVGVSAHDVAGSVIVHPSLPRATATAPLGGTTPEAPEASATVTVTGESAGEEASVDPVMASVVTALPTVKVRSTCSAAA